MTKALFKTIRRRLNRSKRLHIQTNEVLSKLSAKFVRSEREVFHAGRKHFANCLYCHAVPGTLEVVISELYDLAMDRPAKTLLNLGGGTGQVSEILEYLGFHVINVDIEANDDGVRNFNHDLNSVNPLPFNPNSFDFVLCQEVIEHIENPWKLFRDISGVLKQDGYLILTTPNIQSSHSKTLFQKTNYFHWFTPECHTYHINPLPMWEVHLIANKLGFYLTKTIGNGELFAENANDRDLINDDECLIFILKKQ